MDMADPEWQDREGVGEREIERERERCGAWWSGGGRFAWESCLLSSFSSSIGGSFIHYANAAFAVEKGG